MNNAIITSLIQKGKEARKEQEEARKEQVVRRIFLSNNIRITADNQYCCKYYDVSQEDYEAGRYDGYDEEQKQYYRIKYLEGLTDEEYGELVNLYPSALNETKSTSTANIFNIAANIILWIGIIGFLIFFICGVSKCLGGIAEQGVGIMLIIFSFAILIGSFIHFALFKGLSNMSEDLRQIKSIK